MHAIEQNKATRPDDPIVTDDGFCLYIKETILKQLVSMGQVDPAFAYPAEKHHFVPSHVDFCFLSHATAMLIHASIPLQTVVLLDLENRWNP